MRRIVLASASPRRKELLEQIGVSFEVMATGAGEDVEAGTPQETVTRLAVRKAGCAAAELEKQGEKDVLIIGADTLVAAQGRILGKPRDKEEAAAMLRSLSGREHQVCTGVSLILLGEKGRQEKAFCRETLVEMYPMTEEEIQGYLATGEPMDKAGAYGIQGMAARFIRRIQGDYNTVVGLPAGSVYQEIKAWL